LSDTRKVSSGFRARKVVTGEDRAQIRDIPSKVLHDMGCEVHHFSGAGEALKHIESGPDVDLLFTDLPNAAQSAPQTPAAAMAG
jgi:CheY-like chemotaxis protein